MPGLVAFRRRWRIGSDDLVVPALVLVAFDAIWVIAAVVALPTISAEERDHPELIYADLPPEHGLRLIRLLLTICVFVLLLCVMVEGAIAYVSTRGTIMNDKPRARMVHLVHLRTVLLIAQLGCAIAGIVWLIMAYYPSYLHLGAANILIGIIVWNLLIVLLTSLVAVCSYDPSGGGWVALTRFERKQLSQPNAHHPEVVKRANSEGQLRKSHFQTAYQDSWSRWCRNLLCCCLPKSQDEGGSLAEVARLMADFFKDHDLVPSDIVAGLVLLRRRQKQIRKRLIERADCETYEYLSGAAINPTTEFLDLRKPESLELLTSIRYYMQYALGAYGWLFYLNENSHGRLCMLLRNIRCCSCMRRPRIEEPEYEIVEDDCCFGHSTALTLTIPPGIGLVYVNFHCGIGRTPFYVAIDREQNSVVVCIRGTLSLKDLITDLCAAEEDIPLDDAGDMKSAAGLYQAHQGVVIGAKYVLAKLLDEGVLKAAFSRLPEGKLVIVGHSLGGGIATVVGLVLRRKAEYRDLRCFAFAPPGGLLSKGAAAESKEFCTAVMVGKDCVPRMGLEQMARLRADLIFLIEASRDTKWKIISQSLPWRCCRTSNLKIDRQLPELAIGVENKPISLIIKSADFEKGHRRYDSSPAVMLSDRSQRLYPPGSLLHVVRTWTEASRLEGRPGYAAIWADEESLREMVISPVMVHDHMPAGLIAGLDRVLECCVEAQSSSTVDRHSTPPEFTREFYERKSQRRKHQAGIKRVELRSSSSAGLERKKIRRSTSSPALQFGEDGEVIVFRFDDHVRHSSVKRKTSRPKVEVDRLAKDHSKVVFEMGPSDTIERSASARICSDVVEQATEEAWVELYRKNDGPKTNTTEVAVVHEPTADDFSSNSFSTIEVVEVDEIQPEKPAKIRKVRSETDREAIASDPLLDNGERHRIRDKCQTEASLSQKSREKEKENGDGHLFRTREMEDVRLLDSE
uniref:sn-1-specific diacylglycerol lipase n=1 Tax=Plectus sambesii TaxID=2011161 RepID=A0A914WX69_9BILA